MAQALRETWGLRVSSTNPVKLLQRLYRLRAKAVERGEPFQGLRFRLSPKKPSDIWILNSTQEPTDDKDLEEAPASN